MRYVVRSVWKESRTFLLNLDNVCNKPIPVFSTAVIIIIIIKQAMKQQTHVQIPFNTRQHTISLTLIICPEECRHSCRSTHSAICRCINRCLDAAAASGQQWRSCFLFLSQHPPWHWFGVSLTELWELFWCPWHQKKKERLKWFHIECSWLFSVVRKSCLSLHGNTVQIQEEASLFWNKWCFGSAPDVKKEGELERTLALQSAEKERESFLKWRLKTN